MTATWRPRTHPFFRRWTPWGGPLVPARGLRRGRAFAVWLGCAAVAFASGPGAAAESTGDENATAGAPRIALDFRNAEIDRVVAAVADATGRSFLFDDRLRGRVTISVPEPVTVEEGLDILEAALRMKGFAALPAPGGVLRIEPLDRAVTRAPVRVELAQRGSDATAPEHPRAATQSAPYRAPWRGARLARFSVRVALFEEPAAAAAQLASLRARGLEGAVAVRAAGDHVIWELRLGPFEDLEGARRAAAEAEAGGRADPVIEVVH